jgi:hypothetical protein
MSRPDQGGNGHSAVGVLELRGVSKTYGRSRTGCTRWPGWTYRCGPGRWWRSWGRAGQHGGRGGPSCTLRNDCLTNPTMQTVSNLPSGTSAPSTVITEYAVHKYHLQTHLNGWLIQAPAPLSAAQIHAAQRLALAYQAPLGIASGGPDLGEIADAGTVLGIIIALGVLAASVGLIRSETGRDLRTLTQPGPALPRGGRSPRLVWAHASLSAMFGDLPLTDVLILLLGLPLIVAAGGWLFAGRKPPAVARQPLE